MADMDYYPDGTEWERVRLMAMEIHRRKEYLSNFRNREKLSAGHRMFLVKFQIETAEMISDLKMIVRNYRQVPQYVMDIYY